VREDLGHRDHGVRRLGELAVADRERQHAWLRADRPALVDEHAAWRVGPAREVRRPAREADPDEADGAVAEPARGLDGHHLVGGVDPVLAHRTGVSPRKLAWYAATSAVSSTCRFIHSWKRSRSAAIASQRT